MKRDPKWVVPRNTTLNDPRIAIAKQIGWSRSLTNFTDFSSPEPDNYNYAVLNPLPWECPFINDQVFYRDRQSNHWWTVYYVPEEQEQEFLAWADPLPFEQRWTPLKSAKIRNQRPLLWTRNCAVEQTIEERLYTMGYYDKLQSTYNIDISNVLGSPRLNMPHGEFS